MKKGFINILAIVAITAIISAVSFGFTTYKVKQVAEKNLGATILQTELANTIGTFRTNVNTSLTNINNALSNATSGDPGHYHTLSNDASATGTLPIAKGGTGITTTPSNGSLLIGSSTSWAANTLTAGSNITITNATGTITITSTGVGNLFGDGSDGTGTISATTTLTADKYYTTLTVNSGITLYPAGYRIFVNDTLTNNGFISANGGNGGNGAVGADSSGQTGGNGGAGGTATSSLPSGTYSGALGSLAGQGGKGGAGLNPGTAGNPTTILNGSSTIVSIGVNGVAGAIGGTSDGAADTPGTAGTRTLTNTVPRNYFTAVWMAQLASTTLFSGSASNGMSSGGDGGAQGSGGNNEPAGGGGGAGGSGAPGGILAIYSKTITNTGTISVNGGNGGNGAQGGRGTCTSGTGGGAGGGGAGGAAGSGGAVILVYSTLTDTGTISANAGTVGTGGIAQTGVINNGCASTVNTGQAGSNGTTGNAGIIYQIDL